MLGVLAGGVLTYKLNLKFQKEITKKEIKIEKLQDMSNYLHDSTRALSLILLALKKYINGIIKHEEFCKENDDMQEKIRIAYRYEYLNNSFIGSNSTKIRDLFKEYDIIANMIYDKYHDPNSIIKMYKHEQISYELIEGSVLIYMEKAYAIMKDINKEIEMELM